MTHATDDDVVPLPDSLHNCGCRFAPSQHRLDCQAALDYEKQAREVGRRYRWFSWEFPLRISANINVDISLDPVGVIVAHADEYEQFELERGYEPYEKPIQFLCHLIEDQIDASVWFGDTHLSRDSSYFDGTEEHPRWTPDDTARVEEALHAAKLAASHPNLFEEGQQP
jgi:hypothetical protein